MSKVGDMNDAWLEAHCRCWQSAATTLQLGYSRFHEEDCTRRLVTKLCERLFEEFQRIKTVSEKPLILGNFDQEGIMQARIFLKVCVDRIDAFLAADCEAQTDQPRGLLAAGYIETLKDSIKVLKLEASRLNSAYNDVNRCVNKRIAKEGREMVLQDPAVQLFFRRYPEITSLSDNDVKLILRSAVDSQLKPVSAKLSAFNRELSFLMTCDQYLGVPTYVDNKRI